MPYFLGIDIGTSGIRVIVINQQQQIVAQNQHPFPDSDIKNLTAGQDHFSESKAEIWWQILEALFSNLANKIDLKQVLAIAVDGTSGTILAIDKTGKPLHNALMYNDQRAISQSQRLNSICPLTDKKFLASSGLAKILWLWEHLAQDKIHHFINQADWIAGKLTGQFAVSDYNNVLKMGYDVQKKQWPEWFQQLDFPLKTLPQVKPAGQFIESIHPDMCQYGFTEQVQIISGTTDSTAAVMASGANQIGDTITSLGSTLVTKIIADTFIEDSSTGVYSQPYGKYWLVGGSSNTGGVVLRQNFSSQQIIQLSQQIDFSHPTNLDYYPLPKTGERFPIADSHKKPLLTPRPKNNIHYFQAILEGITTIEKQAYQILNSLGCPKPIKNYTMGGGTQNTRWMHYRQNQLAFPVILPAHQEAAYGVAKLARLGYKKL